MQSPFSGNSSSLWVRFWLPVVCLVVLLSGCAKIPQAELESARRDVTSAGEMGAEHWSPGEYLLATRALEVAERQISERQYRAAQRTLALAQRYAESAQQESIRAQQLLAEQERLVAEQQRLVEAERQRQRQLQRAEEELRLKEEERKRREALARAAAQQATREKTEEVLPPAEPAAPEPIDQYEVGVGQTLGMIAELPEVYGDSLLWPLIYRANRDQIKTPQEISVGQVLVIPRDKNREEIEAARQEARELNLF